MCFGCCNGCEHQPESDTSWSPAQDTFQNDAIGTSVISQPNPLNHADMFTNNMLPVTNSFDTTTNMMSNTTHDNGGISTDFSTTTTCDTGAFSASTTCDTGGFSNGGADSSSFDM